MVSTSKSYKKAEKKRVILLTTTFPRWEGDSAMPIIFDIAKQINEMDVEVTVLAPHHPGARFMECLGGVLVLRFPYFWPTVYERLCYGAGILFNFRDSWFAKIQIPLLLLAETFYSIKLGLMENFDLLNAYWIFPSGLVGVLCKKIFKKPLIISCQGSDVSLCKQYKFLKSISVYVLKNADIVTTVTIEMKDSLVSCGVPGNKIEVIYNGVDVNFFTPKKRPFNGFRILYVGRLVHEKGLEELIEAVGKTRNLFPEICLRIVGDGPMRKDLDLMIDNLSIREHVIFEGFRPHSEISGYMDESDLFVLPSYSEGMPLVVLEAMASGIPVIASRVGGVPEVIRDGFNGFLVEPKDSEALAKRIEEVLSDRDLLRKVSINAAATIRQGFSVEKAAEKISRLYERTLRRVQ